MFQYISHIRLHKADVIFFLNLLRLYAISLHFKRNYDLADANNNLHIHFSFAHFEFNLKQCSCIIFCQFMKRDRNDITAGGLSSFEVLYFLPTCAACFIFFSCRTSVKTLWWRINNYVIYAAGFVTDAFIVTG